MTSVGHRLDAVSAFKLSDTIVNLKYVVESRCKWHQIKALIMNVGFIFILIINWNIFSVQKKWLLICKELYLKLTKCQTELLPTRLLFAFSWSGWHRKHQNGLQFQSSGAPQLSKEEDSSWVSVWIRLLSKISVLTQIAVNATLLFVYRCGQLYRF